MSLSSQRVVIIGGTSGIGLATAHAVVAAGADVVIASSRQSSVDSALEELSGHTTGHALDVLEPRAVVALFDEIGDFDHLVYTAGEALTLMPVEEFDLDKAQAAFRIRYFGALGAVRAATPHLRPGGSITLTSGSAGVRPGAGWAIAASICGATTSLAKSLAVELAPIRVNVVEPGVVRSPLWSGMGEADQRLMYEQQAAAVPVGRVGEVDDIARAFVYAMTQTFMSGTSIPVDGGALLV